MSRALFAAVFYFLLILGAGMFFGTIRELLVVRWLGPVWSRFIEIPLMLVFSFIAAGIAARRLNVPEGQGARLLMGLLAFLMLQGAEFLLGAFLFRMSASGYLQQTATPMGLFMLAAQSLIIVFPLLVVRPRAQSDA